MAILINSLGTGPKGGGHFTPTPAGALVWLDFVNEVYVVNGEQVPASSIFDGFLMSLALNKGGLRVSDVWPTRVLEAIGGLSDVIVAGLTGGMIVALTIAETRAAGEYIGPLFVVTDTNFLDSTDWVGFEYGNYNDPADVWFFDNDGTDWNGNVPHLDGPRVSGIAMLISADNEDTAGTYRYGFAANGSTPVYTDVGYLPDWLPPGMVHLFGLRGDTGRLPWDVHVRTMAIFPADDVSVLQGYSTVTQPPKPAAVDPPFGNVVFLADFDTANTAGTPLDLSDGGHAMTLVGDAQLDGAVTPPFSATTALLLDGSGDRVTIPVHSDFVLGSSPWAIDLYAYATDGTGTETLISAGGSWEIATVSGELRFRYHFSGAWQEFLWGVSLPASTWAHVLVVHFADGRTYGFLDGAVVLLTSFISGMTSPAGGIGIGGRYSDGSDPFEGRIGSVRVTKGASFQDSPLGFTPRTIAFPTI